MQAWYHGKPATVWVIGKNSPQPDWVQQAFAKRQIVWLDNHIRVLMAALQPDAAANLKTGLVATIGGGFTGYNMYVLGYPGDVLDATNRRIVTAAQFQNQYTQED